MWSQLKIEKSYLNSKVTELEQEVTKIHEEAKSAFTDLKNKMETVEKENLDQTEKLSKFQFENNEWKSKATELEQKVIY
jgi:predicted nuclease with TOPRIM domain